MLKKLWEMVNSSETIEDVAKTEKVIRSAGDSITNDEFDELMMALSYISRECYHRK